MLIPNIIQFSMTSILYSISMVKFNIGQTNSQMTQTLSCPNMQDIRHVFRIFQEGFINYIRNQVCHLVVIGRDIIQVPSHSCQVNDTHLQIDTLSLNELQWLLKERELISSITKKIAISKSILIYKNFQTWSMIGWQHSCQPIRSQVWKFLLTTNVLNNPGLGTIVPVMATRATSPVDCISY